MQTKKTAVYTILNICMANLWCIHQYTCQPRQTFLRHKDLKMKLALSGYIVNNARYKCFIGSPTGVSTQIGMLNRPLSIPLNNSYDAFGAFRFSWTFCPRPWETHITPEVDWQTLQTTTARKGVADKPNQETKQKKANSCEHLQCVILQYVSQTSTKPQGGQKSFLPTPVVLHQSSFQLFKRCEALTDRKSVV